MGSFLEKPVVEKTSENGSENNIIYALASMQGWRKEQEDAHTLIASIQQFPTWSFFAVYDGHAGGDVSQESSKRLIQSILEQEYMKSLAETENKKEYEIDQIKKSIVDGFLQLDEQLRKEELSSGCTVIALLITDNHFFFINCGDSRAMLIRKEDSSYAEVHPEYSEGNIKDIEESYRQINQMVAKEQKVEGDDTADVDKNPYYRANYLKQNSKPDRTHMCYEELNNPVPYTVHFATRDHKPYDEEEKNRVEAAGGMVIIQRINGALAVSRALGDFDYKRVDGLPPQEQLVSPVPHITVIDRVAEKDALVMIACDGLYDVLCNRNLSQYIMTHIQMTRASESLEDYKKALQKTALEALDLCLHKGSRDNMSAILLGFPNMKPDFDKQKYELNSKMEQELKDYVIEFANNPPNQQAIGLVNQAKSSMNYTHHGHIMDYIMNYEFTTDKYLGKFDINGASFHGKYELIRSTLHDQLQLLANKESESEETPQSQP